MTLSKLFLCSLSVVSLLFEPALGSRGISSSRVRRGNTPSLPIASGTTQDCVFWFDNDGTIDCEFIPEFYGITLEDFLKWNPSLTDSCGNFQEGYSFCVEGKADTGTPTVTTSTKTTTTKAPTTTTAPGNGIKTPEPVQPGIVNNCDEFYLVKEGEGCRDIATKHGITLAQFTTWNSKTGTNCAALWVDTYACVSITGHTPTPTEPNNPGNGIETPSPIQNGMAKNCNKFHLVKSTTTCTSIEEYYKLPWADFYKWNPAVGSTCTSLLTDYYVCVSVVGFTTPTTPTTPDNGISTPSPIQVGMTKDCNKFHLIKSTTTCASIRDYYNLPLAEFYKWNPAVGNTCTSLLVDYYVCVSIIGFTPPTPTEPGNGISTPSPIQTGMTKNCNKFHLVKSTTTCVSIQDYYKISFADFYKWNPAIGSKCTSLWADTNVCVGIIGGGTTPTNPGNGIETPKPIQDGMTKSCKKFHLVKSTTTCASIQNYYKITLAQLYKWNPAIGSTCRNLWAEYNVCVGV
ncbi:hypothetical protein EDB80DRAFT_827002 [Ilyonectria destructans]|nr:hypothetical protein EDB80DRAFT_827002 [Ilyonectria destructans]